MEETFVPFRGIKNDLRGRLMCYKQDWAGGFRAGFRYILTLSLLVTFSNHLVYVVHFLCCWLCIDLIA